MAATVSVLSRDRQYTMPEPSGWFLQGGCSAAHASSATILPNRGQAAHQPPPAECTT